ncbi:hypothetical protein HanRHA438_Chr14g0639761 [Helianthus annuus]|uniref:Uncharacterized protein n=1 Tax=Helianthus annuus TaxID=4232 RepID=A0A9K3E816_HELAN|nr:hypothetical protein HanXRQr2_Chr14g0628721 [Helianthus annuus]KAJ0463243.1 hypothetical protein HanHA300_Chr14g0513411 [Helianthus annuus]KAJ0467145.1 hypothetical protein HanIR_Chr14g0682091 [Helianthus annuus]KAJ0484620.1 hypothetical protein HanHA89_Chr14g0558891 [Helianthus annuus]KAJ0602188.1 hypothetical protein HanIR_Chr03g0136861 [Helianthus annuus]
MAVQPHHQKLSITNPTLTIAYGSVRTKISSVLCSEAAQPTSCPLSRPLKPPLNYSNVSPRPMLESPDLESSLFAQNWQPPPKATNRWLNTFGK